MSLDHPLRAILEDAGRGRFPKADLGVEVLGSPPGRADAVVAFSGHNLIAAALDPDEVLRRLPDDDPGAPVSAAFVSWLGDALGSVPGTLDLVMVTAGTGEPPPELTSVGRSDHRRVARAFEHRTDVIVHVTPDGTGIVILGRGLAGRLEVSVEVAPERRGLGRGTALAGAARGLVPRDELLWAQVSPGNVASVRAFLAAGYRPVCSEVLFLRKPAVR